MNKESPQKEKNLESNNNYNSNNVNNFPLTNINSVGNKDNFTNNTVRNTHNFDDNLERKSSLNSIRTTKKNETGGPQETVREVMAKFEDNEKLFNDQVLFIFYFSWKMWKRNWSKQETKEIHIEEGTKNQQRYKMGKKLNW